MAASEAKGFLDFLDDDLKPSQIVIERTKIGKRTTSSGAMGFLSFVEGEQDKTDSPQIERIVSFKIGIWGKLMFKLSASFAISKKPMA